MPARSSNLRRSTARVHAQTRTKSDDLPYTGPVVEPPVPGATASVKLMLTAWERLALRSLGYTDEQIREMKPEEGEAILARDRVRDRAETPEPRFDGALDYHGPVVVPPDLGPDDLDDHGAPAQAARLTSWRILEIVDWYKDQTNRRYNDDTLDTDALDAELRALLRAEVLPEFVEVEFKRVMDLVFAV